METYAPSRAASTATFLAGNFMKRKPPSKCGTTPLPPRPENYSEMFGGFGSSLSSRVCSIPVLDLPVFSDVDCGTSGLDYSEIFAGFHGGDFAVPYDKLFQTFDDADDRCSSDEACTPVGSASFSDDSDPFASEKCSRLSREDSLQPLDNNKFTNSNHKVNPEASSCIPNTTHVEAADGCTRVVDRTTSPREMETERDRTVIADDIVFSMDSSPIMLHKHTTMSRSSFDAGLQPVDADHTYERPCSGDTNISHATSKHASVSGTNLKMESLHSPQPSSPPTLLTERDGDIDQLSTGLKNSKGCASKLTVDSRLPPCFDMEINASPSTAVSAAAVKDAMNKAQAKLKGEKVLLDKNKDDLQDAAEPNLKRDVNGNDDIAIELDCADVSNRVHTSCNRDPDDRYVFSPSLPDIVSVEQSKIRTRRTAEEQYGKNSSFFMDTVSDLEDGEWKRPWYNDNSRLAPLAPSNGGGHFAVCERQDDDDGDDERNSDSAEEAYLPERNRRKLKASEAVSRQEYHNRLVRVAQHVHESDICAHAKTDQRSSKCEDTSEKEIRMQRLNECHQFSPGDNEETLERVTKQVTGNKKLIQVSEMEEAVSNYSESEESVSSAHDEWDNESHTSGRFSDREHPVENRHTKPDGADLHENTAEVDPGSPTFESIEPQTESTGFPVLSAWQKNLEDSTVAFDEENELKDDETTMRLDGDKPIDSTAAQTGASDSKHECKVHEQESSDANKIRKKSGGVSGSSGLSLKDENKRVAQSVSDPKLGMDFNIEQRRILDENPAPFDQDKKVKSAPADGNSGWYEDVRNKEAAFTETLQKKESLLRSQLPNNSQNTERKRTTIDLNHSYEVKTNGKDRNMEDEQLRKLEEEREREREREKDRMAVEIAIREARDQAERLAFERAADEARQRAMAEARERLQKACAEARERSVGDKASETRLRAERAAVERATAEARQRAFERATLEARERMQRSVSEKFISEKDVITRQSSMPTMHSVKSEATDGEPAQRCRSRLERHHRTVERVAKALAEKNMRDLVAQREQAERSRLAETLDVDIKRWSSGKEGNLRALLSTLQYILAPDCSWQPIPLTEIVTTAAVKKAYRKAALCVHPDKLQQRGASIQQKYVCEKVFDLLKDAWNKFNSEEK